LIWPAEAQAVLLSCRAVWQRLGLLMAAITMAGAFALPVYAEDWRASLYDEGLPSHLVAVDKHRQTFLFFEKKSPFKLKYSYPCVTGQLPGDKKVSGDLRTPEGVYFVEYKIADGLDFEEYGGIAYTLNYPNPVDRLRGKTGHGIWIHSKGYGLVPTRGCVAIGLDDIGQIGPRLTPGTAVVLAQHLDDQPQLKADDGTARHLRQLMHAWSDAWASRSSAMFDYYDAASYSKGTEDFSIFRRNKERLFKLLDFIKIYNREIHVLEGPGYWVTWAEQFYTASNLSTEGIRRLYWQRGADSRFRIVGMEWTPRDMGMHADFKQGRLVAWRVPPTATDAAFEAPRPPRLDMPEKAGSPVAVLPGRQVALSEPLIPQHIPPAVPAEIEWGQGRSMESGQPQLLPPLSVSTAPPVSPEAEAHPLSEAHSPDRRSQSALMPSESSVVPKTGLHLDAATQKTLEQVYHAWEESFARRSQDIMTFYDRTAYNQLPQTPKGESWKTVQGRLLRQVSLPWLRLISKPPLWTVEGELAVSKSHQLVVSPAGAREGLHMLWWRKGHDGQFYIVASQFKEGNHELAALYLEEVSTAVSTDLEAWRKAWEEARLDAYMAFYTRDAVQQGRRGVQNIRHQKGGLWGRVKPVMVQLTGLRLSMDRQGIRADMHQVYADSAGRSDRGIKTLHLRFDGKRWRIQNEEWSALGADMGQQ